MALLITAGCGATRTVTATVTAAASATTTTIVRHGPRPPARTVTITRTITAAAQPASAPAASTGAPAAVCNQPNTYCGNGSTNLGTITVNADSTLRWECPSCAAFDVSSDLSGQNIISASSQAPSGSTAVYAGTYANVRVIAEGDWAFRISPG